MANIAQVFPVALQFYRCESNIIIFKTMCLFKGNKEILNLQYSGQSRQHHKITKCMAYQLISLGKGCINYHTRRMSGNKKEKIAQNASALINNSTFF